MGGTREPSVSVASSEAALWAAAEMLVGDRAGGATALLDAMGYCTSQSPAELENRTALLRLANQFERMFRIAASAAPGLTAFGAQMTGPVGADGATAWRLSATGAGLDMAAAFENCVGEAAEFLSQWEREEDVVRRASLREVAGEVDEGEAALVAAMLAEQGQISDTPLDWVAGTRLADEREILLPADLVLRRDPVRRALRPDGPMSLGCGAGTSGEVARGRGLLEAVERDAAALWWRGGARGHALPFEREVQSGLLDLMARLRGPTSERVTWFLDITSDLGVPCVAALSSTADGFGMACGLAARPSLLAAAHGALVELCQMELSAPIVATRLRAQGEAALTGADRAVLRRFTGIDTRRHALLHPLPHPRPLSGGAPVDIAARLAAAGLHAGAVKLTRRDIGVEVVLVRVPGLEREPSARVGRRLGATLAKTGGGELYESGIELM